ncbi:NifU family protein [Streptomyces sp. WM6378]|uniref:NifU family protein n=1 Tax=Streptomyces sp. WM6378 TaxID=1415557 RepID=UPI0006AF5123|nr:NifU family protein [Streptomyces sp. WM6378]KOU51876.1 hypothetical protein ADK54_08105 [Streptomyces sp. WM6378]
MSAQTATARATPAPNAEQAGRRVEEILERLTAEGDGETAVAAEELVRVLMDFYGAGMARIVELLEARAADGSGRAGLSLLLEDELVTSLLVLHDLHPEDTVTRIARALDGVQDHAVELVAFDETTGTLRLRSAGTDAGCGCQSTAVAARTAVETALACYAPEVTSVELGESAAERTPVLLQIGNAPPGSAPTGGPDPVRTR